MCASVCTCVFSEMCISVDANVCTYIYECFIELLFVFVFSSYIMLVVITTCFLPLLQCAVSLHDRAYVALLNIQFFLALSNFCPCKEKLTNIFACSETSSNASCLLLMFVRFFYRRVDRRGDNCGFK